MRAARTALAEEYGKPAVLIGSGGSIPVVGSLHRLLGIAVCYSGFGLEDDQVHSPTRVSKRAASVTACAATVAAARPPRRRVSARLRIEGLRSELAGPFDLAVAAGASASPSPAVRSGKSLFLRMVADHLSTGLVFLDHRERDVFAPGMASRLRTARTRSIRPRKFQRPDAARNITSPTCPG